MCMTIAVKLVENPEPYCSYKTSGESRTLLQSIVENPEPLCGQTIVENPEP